MSREKLSPTYHFGPLEWNGIFIQPDNDRFVSWAKSFMKHPLYKDFEVLGVGSFFESFNSDRVMPEIDIKLFGDRPEKDIKTLMWFGFEEGLKRNINIDILWCEKKLSFNKQDITEQDLDNPDRWCIYKRLFREVKMEGITRWEITARPTEGGLWEYKQNMLQKKHFRKNYKVTGPTTVDGLVPTLDHWMEQFCQD